MLFPNALSINTREELEEERRLFYVAITRAKKRLWITYANTRYRFGSLIQNEPSRFIDELPENFMDRSFAGGGAKNQRNTGNGTAFERMKGWSGSGHDWTSDSRQSTKRETPSYLIPKTNIQKVV